eukprot:4943-Heterococcus_DN1.PRE.1
MRGGVYDTDQAVFFVKLVDLQMQHSAIKRSTASMRRVFASKVQSLVEKLHRRACCDCEERRQYQVGFCAYNAGASAARRHSTCCRTTPIYFI